MISVDTEGASVLGRTVLPDEPTKPLGREGDMPIFNAQAPATKPPAATAQPQPQQHPTDQQPPPPKDPGLDMVPASPADYPPIDPGEPPRGCKWREEAFPAARADMHAARLTVRALRELELGFHAQAVPLLAEHDLTREVILQLIPKYVEACDRHDIKNAHADRIFLGWYHRQEALAPSYARSRYTPDEAEAHRDLAELQSLEDQKESPRYKALHARVTAGFQKRGKAWTISND